MNRPLATMFVLIFWANTVFGLPGVCCCSTVVRELANCSDEDFVIAQHDSSCDHRGACGRTCNSGCLSLGCADGMNVVALAESWTIFPQNQVLVSPRSMTDSQESLKTDWLNSRVLLAVPVKSVSLLLQTCSFLS
jgi:hypothetical protein